MTWRSIAQILKTEKRTYSRLDNAPERQPRCRGLLEFTTTGAILAEICSADCRHGDAYDSEPEEAADADLSFPVHLEVADQSQGE